MDVIKINRKNKIFSIKELNVVSFQKNQIGYLLLSPTKLITKFQLDSNLRSEGTCMEKEIRQKP